MSIKVKTIAEVIEDLKGYNPNELIAINWWIDIDVEDYSDKEQALRLAQEYLNSINGDVLSYVEDYYKDWSAEYRARFILDLVRYPVYH